MTYVLQPAEAPGLRFLGLLLGLALLLSGLGFRLLRPDGGLYGAKLEELLFLPSLLPLSQPLLLLKQLRGVNNIRHSHFKKVVLQITGMLGKYRSWFCFHLKIFLVRCGKKTIIPLFKNISFLFLTH